MKYELPKLPFAYDALEPYIDKATMEVHHGKHHATYVLRLNEALERAPKIAERPLEELLHDLTLVPDAVRTAVRNHGGGHWNHAFFWKLLATHGAGGGGEPTGELQAAIIAAFGDYLKFAAEFTNAATTHFGSGWAWLAARPSGELTVLSLPNQDNPLSQGLWPVAALDVWEHAYYLKYQNRRAEYIEAWWKLVNWEQASENYALRPKPKPKPEFDDEDED